MTVDIVPVEMVTAVPVGKALEAQRAYLSLCEQLLDDDDYQRADGKSFKKKSAWRKLAAAFNVSDTILERHYDYDDQGRIVRAEFVVEAKAPNGRTAVGIGLASRHDRRFNNPEHDIPATAHTRAKNRACSDLFGLGEVSAEETDHDRGRDRDDRSVTWGSWRAASRAATEGETFGGVEGSAELQTRLNNLAPKDRASFRDFLRSKALSWPPTTTAGLITMTAEVAVMEANKSADDDAYGSSASGATDAHTSGAGRRRKGKGKDAAGSDEGTETTPAPDPATLATTTPAVEHPHADEPASPGSSVGDAGTPADTSVPEVQQLSEP